MLTNLDSCNTSKEGGVIKYTGIDSNDETSRRRVLLDCDSLSLHHSQTRSKRWVFDYLCLNGILKDRY